MHGKHGAFIYLFEVGLTLTGLSSSQVYLVEPCYAVYALYYIFTTQDHVLHCIALTNLLGR
jgi:hypothetical protein